MKSEAEDSDTCLRALFREVGSSSKNSESLVGLASLRSGPIRTMLCYSFVGLT